MKGGKRDSDEDGGKGKGGWKTYKISINRSLACAQ